MLNKKMIKQTEKKLITHEIENKIVAPQPRHKPESKPENNPEYTMGNPHIKFPNIRPNL
jgi:hypothetical protein